MQKFCDGDDNLFNVCSNHTMFKLQKTRISSTPFAVYISDTSVILKQCQGHQTWNDNVDPKQGYNQTKFQRFCFKDDRKKVTKFFFANDDIYQLTPLKKCKDKK